MNIRKHWKNFLLTTTALFWASCDDSTSTEAQCLYGTPPEYQSSNSNVTPSSSNETPASSSSETAKPESSSSELFNPPVYGDEPVFEESSSSFDPNSMPSDTLYGVSVTEKTCFPMDSSVSYFPNDFSADNAKFWKEEQAKHDAVDKIDSIKQTLAETPMCLENLRMELDRFVALYGAPTVIMNAVESCSDGTTRPSEEYAQFLKMKEEWEANLPALEEELKKVYEDKLKELEARINKCLSEAADDKQ